LRRAPERLDARGLRHPAHPRWRAATEVELILPGDDVAAALHRERRHLVQDPSQRGLVAVRLAPLAEAVQRVRLLERGERVELEALAREVHEHELAPLEGHRVA